MIRTATRRPKFIGLLVVMGLMIVCCRPVHAEQDAQKRVELSSLLGKALTSPPPGDDLAKLEADLSKAREALAAEPDNPEKTVWVGRRLGYLWRMNDAVEVYTKGIAKHPDYAPLYRHRGHRYISLRKFDLAIADLEKAAELMADKTDQMEEDGQPNRMNAPLTTLKYNIYYHLGLARYLSGDYGGAVIAFREGQKHVRIVDDNRISLTYWTYNALRHLGRHGIAKSELIPVEDGMNAIENEAYYRLLRMYAGFVKPDELIPDDASDLDRATLMYGLGSWHLCNGDTEKAKAIYEKIVEGPVWPAFGYLAAEVELLRMKGD